MKTIYYIPMMLLALLVSACERTLEFDPPTIETDNDMVINAVAVADTSFTVYLNQAYPVSESPSMQHMDYQRSLMVRDDGMVFDYQNDDYHKKTAIQDAQVEVEVNGQTHYSMVLDKDKLCYTCNYIPTEGDHIRVIVSAGGKELHAVSVVPDKPRIEIIDHEVIPENPYKELNGLSFGTDTIMRLTCCIYDTGGSKYYRLRIRGERDSQSGSAVIINGKVSNANVYTYYSMQDIYFSSDPLFSDSRLSSNFGGWPAGFSNVFDNSLMKGKNYTFIVESPKKEDTWPYKLIEEDPDAKISDKPRLSPRVMVELQAISPELYRYLKSMQLYRIIQNDKEAEPVQIYSNVQNGWGIFGALSYDRHFVEYGE